MGSPADRTQGVTSAPRHTRQRAALIELLADGAFYRSAQELHAILNERGHHVSVATVYRNLAQMSRAGEVCVLVRDDGEATYVKGSSHHHHPLVCRSCGRAEEISDPTIARWTDAIAAAHGYTGTSHQLAVFGLCPACSGYAGGA